MQIAQVDGKDVTSQAFEEAIVRYKGFRSTIADIKDGYLTLAFNWGDEPPRFQVEHIVLDGRGPSILMLATDTMGIELLDSWHIHEEDFKDVRGPTATVENVTNGVRSSYQVPIAKARFTRSN